MDFFNKNKVGELTSRMSSDITQVQETLKTTIAEFFRQIVIIVGGIAFIFVFSWKLALIMLATVPVMAIVAVFFGRFIRKLSKKAQDQAAESNSIIEESLMGISNVKSFTNEVFLLGKYGKNIEEIRNLNVKSGVWRGLFVSFIIFCLFGAIVFIIWQGLLMTQGPNPELSSKDFFSFIMYTIMMGASIGSLPDLYASIQKTIGATENLMNIINEPSEKQLQKGKEKPVINGNVRFEQVHFAYPQRKDITVLNNISFAAKSNDTIALVGSSGSGKSTILSLISRLYDVTDGEVKIDETEISALNLNDLRNNIGIVPQDAFLFSDTIQNNIKFGNQNATDEEVIKAAKNAVVHDNIIGFNKQYDTILGERGITLSGGQKQRVSIARAIIKNPAILLFDDCLSAVDTETEEMILNNLFEISKDKTTIIVSHRVSSAKNADKIIILEDGRIIQQGSHNQLINQEGYYASLYLKQLSEKELL